MQKAKSYKNFAFTISMVKNLQLKFICPCLQQQNQEHFQQHQERKKERKRERERQKCSFSLELFELTWSEEAIRKISSKKRRQKKNILKEPEK